MGLAAGHSIRAIAAALNRSPSTISREIARNGRGARGYQPLLAHDRACKRARRPKPRRLHTDGLLRTTVQAMMRKKMSPEQISGRLRLLFRDDPGMHVSPETIYQAIYVQSCGSLRRELAACLRTGRAVRRPKGRTERRGRIKDMVMISDRPAEVDDRAVPGHWEGDLIIGKDSGSAIGTLVERSTRHVMLLHLPKRHDTISVRDEVIRAIASMPEQLRKSLTWDQGREMAEHATITVATDVAVYFCNPHSPWQRGSNENTNGLLRQYFPKGTDLSVHSREHLDFVAQELNDRPRKTLGYHTPAERLAELLSKPPDLPAVATTA
jgi:IS30 family transposase